MATNSTRLPILLSLRTIAQVLFSFTIIRNRHGWHNQKLICDYTVGAWIKATAAFRLNIPSDADFYALIGGEGQSSVSASNLADSAAAVGLDTVLRKDVIGHLLFLLLDRNHSGTVPSEKALENLYQGFEMNNPAEIRMLNDEINSKYFRGAFPADYDIRPVDVNSVSTDTNNANNSLENFTFHINARGFKPEWLNEMLRREAHVQKVRDHES